MEEQTWGISPLAAIEGRCPCMCGDCLCTCRWVPWSTGDDYGQREGVHVDRRNGHTSALSGPGQVGLQIMEIH